MKKVAALRQTEKPPTPVMVKASLAFAIFASVRNDPSATSTSA
jgi:hypothetical protein